MTEELFVHKVAAKTLTEKLELQWYMTEQSDGRILNQILVGPPDDDEMTYEPEFDIGIDIGSLKKTRPIWRGLVRLVDLLKEEKK